MDVLFLWYVHSCFLQVLPDKIDDGRSTMRKLALGGLLGAGFSLWENRFWSIRLPDAVDYRSVMHFVVEIFGEIFGDVNVNS